MLFVQFSSYMQVVTMRLPPFLFTSHILLVKLLLPAFGIVRRKLQVCLMIRSNVEFLFRLVCFPQTWPTVSRDGEEAGLSLAGSLQFPLVKCSMNLQCSATTFIITCQIEQSSPIFIPLGHYFHSLHGLPISSHLFSRLVMNQIREWGFFLLLVHEADTKPLVLAKEGSW